MGKKISILVSILVIIVVIAIFAGGFFVYQYFATQKQQIQNQQINNIEPSIIVFSPSEGEVVTIGQNYKITWSPISTKVNVLLEIYDQIGNQIGNPQYLAQAIDDIGVYNWIPSSSLNIIFKYKIKITEANDLAIDVSDTGELSGFFTLADKMENFGIIEGSLSYPSDFIPADIRICAEEILNKKQYCTDSHIRDDKYTYREGYKIEVPVGLYYVFSSLRNYRAYYSEFVTCGIKIDCPSHEPIVVNVKERQITSDIDPWDWYK
jgi:hypothetical protein